MIWFYLGFTFEPEISNPGGIRKRRNAMKKSDLRRKHSAIVVANSRAASARRHAIANDFRERLRGALTTTNGSTESTVGQDTLIEIAVCAYTEMREISAYFLRGNASSKALTRLGLASSRLVRILNALGLTHVTDDVPEEPAGAALNQYVEGWRARQKPNGDAAPGDSWPTGGQ